MGGAIKIDSHMSWDECKNRVGWVCRPLPKLSSDLARFVAVVTIVAGRSCLRL